jgi:hypothetical protein
VLNDGITPVTSAIFLPPNVAREQYIARETDFEKVRGRVDVRQARVFRNVDHLTFIDGVRPVNTIINATSGVIRDELNPQDGQKDIFDWILGDILSLDQNKLVKERKDNDNKDKLGQTAPAATSTADAVNQEAAIPMVQPQ